MGTLDEELREADPAARLRRDEATAIMNAMAREIPSQPAAAPTRRWWWKSWKIAVPVGAAAILALTGAAIATPLVLAVGEPDNWVELDARIPITYETESGVSVSCMYGAYVRSGNDRTVEDERVAEFLAEENWTGVGQEVYDYAIAHPVTPKADEVWTNDSPEVRDTISFKLALASVITARLPPEMQGAGLASTDTCNGPFR